MVTKILLKLIASVLLIATSVPTWATVTALLDRTRLYQDELLTLTVRISPAGNISTQDVNALESLFVIVNRSQQRSTQTINGRSTSVTEYRFTLAPKEIGKLGIPAFQVDNRSSQPMFVDVVDVRNRQDGLTEDDIRLEATLANKEIYIDQPTLLTVKLVYRIGLSGGRIASIDLDGINAELLNETQTTEQRNGMPYNVYQQTYQIVAKTAGQFTIPELVFSGQYRDAATRQIKGITRTASSLALTVKDIPAEFPADAFWLPTTDLAIADNLNSTLTLSAGEHFDWQIMLSAVAIEAEALPNPLGVLSRSPEWRVYQNQPQFQTRPNYNSRTDTAAITPTSSATGTYTLPAVRIPWWDLTNDELAWAELPERKVSVVAAASMAQEEPQPAAESRAAEQPTELSTDTFATAEKHPVWLWLSLAINLALVLVVAFLLLVRQRATNIETASEPSTTNRPTSANTLAAVYQQILQCAREQNTDLSILIKLLSETQQREFEQLKTTLFSKQTSSALSLSQAQALLNAVTKIELKKGTQHKQDLQLYPN